MAWIFMGGGEKSNKSNNDDNNGKNNIDGNNNIRRDGNHDLARTCPLYAPRQSQRQECPRPSIGRFKAETI